MSTNLRCKAAPVLAEALPCRAVSLLLYWLAASLPRPGGPAARWSPRSRLARPALPRRKVLPAWQVADFLLRVADLIREELGLQDQHVPVGAPRPGTTWRASRSWRLRPFRCAPSRPAARRMSSWPRRRRGRRSRPC